MPKKKKAKKFNQTDATLRNVRAGKKRDSSLGEKLKAFQTQFHTWVGIVAIDLEQMNARLKKLEGKL